jgi:Protein of unknown function (DUF3592)
MRAAVFSAVGVLLLVYWWILRRRSARTKHWPAVKGVITESRVSFTRDSNGVNKSAVVRYAYTVAATPFAGGRINIGNSTGNPDKAVARYPRGAEVMVYYDPGKPDLAVLEPGAAGVWFWLAFAACSLLIGLGSIGSN